MANRNPVIAEKFIKRHFINIVLLAFIFLGIALRLSFFLGSDFPLHDGGFFYVMVQDLISNQFSLPDFSSYNQAGIPFIYPPFGIYFVGLSKYIFGLPLNQLFRMIPFTISALAVPAFYFLSREILKDRWTAVAATAVYSLLPMGFKWLILGGGVTRGFGVLFAILALLFVMRFTRWGGWLNAILGSLFCGFTVLSHPEGAWFLFYSLGAFITVKLIAREKMILLRAFIILLGTMAVVLPWLHAVFSRHGWNIVQPLLMTGFSRWTDIFRFILLDWSGELFFPFFTLFAFFGLVKSVQDKKWYLAIWLPLVFILQGRAANQRAAIPLALLAGLGIIEAIRHLKTRFKNMVKPAAIAFLVSVVYVYALIGSIVSAARIAIPLGNQYLESFNWISTHTAPDAGVLVMTGENWIYDSYSEWMSALTGRQSVSLVQGYEWLPGFSDRIAQHDRLRREFAKGMGLLIASMDEKGPDADYMVLPKIEPTGIDNWSAEPTLHWQDIQLYPGVEKVFENGLVLIVDLRSTS